MIDKSQAQTFALDWIAAWNRHDLNEILSHYSDDFEFTSPFVRVITGEQSGALCGKGAVGAYWAKALARSPRVEFKLQSVLWGVSSLVINYRREDGRTASEWLEFGDSGKVIRSCAHYAD
jgi:ketosteroid isomerase-like protein